MNFLFPTTESPKNQIQTRLMILAVIFVFIGCVVLTLAPAVRVHSWIAEYRWQHWIGFVVWILGFAILLKQMNRILPDRDPYLLPIIALLTGWGLLTIFRLAPSFGFRQSAWLAVCIAGTIIALRIPSLLQILRRYKYIWLSLGILLTLLTFILGTYPGGEGPGLWLGFGGVYLQPSEILKILLIIYLSAYLADRLPVKFNLLQLLTPTLIIGGSAFLILIAQRDLGTASLFIVLYTIVVYLASGKRRVLLFSFLLIIAGLIAGYLFFDVIQLRIEAWLNPWLDPRGRSYQIIQSIISVANGGLFGRGIGLGSPGVVPVSHSDFIFPAMVEEFGLSGGIALVCLLAFLCIRGISISLHAPNHFQRFLAAGLTAYLSTQAILIMGGTIRLLPLTGVTLPFISYGGTSLVISFFSGLLLVIISNQAEDNPATIERSKPYVLVGSVFLAGFAAIALFVGWWSMIRSGDLLDRVDNPRKAISDRYVYRGTIFDRNNVSLAEITGKAGAYLRQLNYPKLSSVIGYSNANYGQTGIEFTMDGYLRGITGNSIKNVWTARTLYSQYPPGFDLRLSIDLQIQEKADEKLADKTGALILMDASSGEVLAMATSPTFNAALLEEKWEAWMADNSAPLLNRVTQAQYPPGSAIGGLILARFLSNNTFSPAVLEAEWSTDPNSPDFCAILPNETITWGKLISSGCLSVLSTLSQSLPFSEVMNLLSEAGLFDEPNIPLESSLPVVPDTAVDYSSLYSGKANFLVSPLQVAIMAAALSNNGRIISPQIAVAYKSLENDWVLIDQGKEAKFLADFNAVDAVSKLSQGNFPGWEISSLAINQNAAISWYIAGTPPEWYSTSLVLVVALENASPVEAQTIGRDVFLSVISPVLD